MEIFYIDKTAIMRLDITKMAIYNQDTVTKLVKKRRLKEAESKLQTDIRVDKQVDLPEEDYVDCQYGNIL